jgi:WhiB family redox-sensing transcriptional regulator
MAKVLYWEESEQLDQGEESLSRDWTLLALCKECPEAFDDESRRTKRQARATCAKCPVRSKCLEFALALGREAKGYWGGTSEKQRQWMRACEGATSSRRLRIA